MLPSASDLTYFFEVAHTLNFSRAAERLGIAQPSLTLAIQRLETCLGLPVFHRTKKGVTLTQAGKQLIKSTRILLDNWNSVRSQAIASTDEVQGTYILGCHPSVALYSLGLFLPELLKKYARLEVHLRHDLSRVITEEVIRSQIDLALVVNPVRHPDLIIHKLCEDEVTFWSRQEKLDITQLSEHIVICDEDLIQTQSLVKELRKKGHISHRILSSRSLEVISDLTAKGTGIGILPSRVARKSVDRLWQVKGAPVFKDEICLLYRVENKSVRSIQIFKEAIQRAFS